VRGVVDLCLCALDGGDGGYGMEHATATCSVGMVAAPAAAAWSASAAARSASSGSPAGRVAWQRLDLHHQWLQRPVVAGVDQIRAVVSGLRGCSGRIHDTGTACWAGGAAAAPEAAGAG
jgi:hypothetical protein